MNWLFWLAWRELWRRRWRSLLALVALALGVGLVVATGSIGALMQASLATSSPRLGQPADLWISSAYDADYDLPIELVQRVEAVPGVEAVQPVLGRPVRVQTPSTGGGEPRSDALTLLGVEADAYFRARDLSLAAGSLPAPEAPGLVALSPWAFVRELRLGQPVTITTPSGDVPLPVVGLVAVENLAAVQQGLVLYAPLGTVADLFGLEGAITAVEVHLLPGASTRRVHASLEEVLGPAYAVSRTSHPVLGGQLWERLVLGALLFVDALTLAGSVALIYAVSASSARARQRQIGLLRAAGATRRQVLALLLLEASGLGLVGSALGLLVGLLFARLAVSFVLPGAGSPHNLPLPAGWCLLAVALGLLASLAGATGPALQIARRPPLVALRIALPLVAPGATGYRGLAVPPWLPAEVRLAAANLARERRRAFWAAGLLALILAMALGNVGILSLLGDELSATFARLTGGDYLIVPALSTISLRELAGQDTSDVPPLAPSLLAALEGLEDQVWLLEGTTADVETLQVFPGQPTLLLDIEGYAQMGGFHFLAGSWASALQVFDREPAVLLAPVVARRLGVDLGDQVRLDTLRGPVDFRVAGIGDSEFTTCVLDLADGAAYLGANEVNAVLVQVRPQAGGAAVRRALLDAVQAHGGTLLTLDQASSQLRRMVHQARLSIALLIVITGIVAVLGVLNAMLSSVAERRREIGLLRAVGATRLQIRRQILAEMALLGATAALVGTLLGWAATLLFWHLARARLGLAGAGSLSAAAWLPLLVASVAGIGLWPLLAMVGGLIPALYAARLPVTQALADTAPD